MTRIFCYFKADLTSGTPIAAPHTSIPNIEGNRFLSATHRRPLVKATHRYSSWAETWSPASGTIRATVVEVFRPRSLRIRTRRSRQWSCRTTVVDYLRRSRTYAGSRLVLRNLLLAIVQRQLYFQHGLVQDFRSSQSYRFLRLFETNISSGTWKWRSKK